MLVESAANTLAQGMPGQAEITADGPSHTGPNNCLLCKYISTPRNSRLACVWDFVRLLQKVINVLIAIKSLFDFQKSISLAKRNLKFCLMNFN